MTENDAIELAKKHAKSRRWTWIGKVVARRRRRWWIVGRQEWHVLSNVGALGCNVRVVIDDATAEITTAAFAPR